MGKHEVRLQTRKARLELYFKTCSDLYRMMFPEDKNREESEFNDAVRSLISSDGFSSTDPREMLGDIYAEIEARRIKGKSADGRSVIQVYFGSEQPDTHVLYEAKPDMMEFNITAHSVEADDSAPGARSYIHDGYSWAMVAFGSDSLTRVDKRGTYESSRDIAQWLQRLKLKEDLEAVFRGA